MATENAVIVRHARGRWRTTIHRPASTFAEVTDPAALARHDVHAMLETIRRRAGLTEPPPL
jgi:hypothetical protein